MENAPQNKAAADSRAVDARITYVVRCRCGRLIDVPVKMGTPRAARKCPECGTVNRWPPEESSRA